MKIFKQGTAALMLVSASLPAIAAQPSLYPIQVGRETVRYFKGVPTLDLETETGAVQVTPLAEDHGSLSFGIGVYNKGSAPLNFGIENIAVHAGPQLLAVFSKDQLVSKAKSRAAWSAVGIALLAGATAAAASTAHTTQTYRSYTHTPFGGVSTVARWRDNSAGVVGAGLAAGAGGAAIAGVQNRLDWTIAHMNDEIVQTTTVEPDASYGGRIVVDKIKDHALPQDVKLVVSVNGVDYPFSFRLTTPGKNVPAAFTALTLVPDPRTAPAAAAPITASGTASEPVPAIAPADKPITSN